MEVPSASMRGLAMSREQSPGALARGLQFGEPRCIPECVGMPGSERRGAWNLGSHITVLKAFAHLSVFPCHAWRGEPRLVCVDLFVLSFSWLGTSACAPRPER